MNIHYNYKMKTIIGFLDYISDTNIKISLLICVCTNGCIYIYIYDVYVYIILCI